MVKKNTSSKQAQNKVTRSAQTSTITSKSTSKPFPSIFLKQIGEVDPQILLADQIILLHGLLTISECQAFTKFIDGLPLELTPPKKRGEAERINYRFSVQSSDFAQTLFSLLVPHLPELLTDGGQKKPVACNSNIRMYKYTPAQYFGPHYDDSVIDPTTGARSEWTVLIYLTGAEDGVEGGETLFFKTEKRKPSDTVIAPLTRGTALLHRHGQHCLFHEGSKVLKGIKYVLRSDLMFLQ
ncbi:hypothetical protein Moror_6460 [Moniliophthora roreri MCA 2997]|uniref:Fe2OG dioxygenase domain-containing protein n=2 Tax=Moniliophthora roreri TaxID=221103 RepID=V2XSZ0_MONRO|nr:hypothetical protein Moror_6460 [Moniliophthora roreri MCA 2997]KAI3610517.1 hypothetical protein WG66_007076 [Moniliophthora roreri]